MIFILFGLSVAALAALVLGLISPRLVPVPPPATRALVAMLYGGFLFAGGIMLATLTRDLWLPVPPVAAVSVAIPVEPAPSPKLEPKIEPAPVPKPDPLPEPIVAPPAPDPVPQPVAALPAPTPPPDPGPPPEPPTRFGPKALGQSAAKLRQVLTEQGLVTTWDAQTGPLGQAVQVAQGTALALFSEGEEDRLYRVQITTDLGSTLADLGPVARDTARLQLGLLGLALAPISPEPGRLRQDSDRVWQDLLAVLLAAPEQPRAARTIFVAGAALRLTLSQAGKASAQLAAEERDLDPLLDVQP